MRETRLSGSEGGGEPTTLFLPLYEHSAPSRHTDNLGLDISYPKQLFLSSMEEKASHRQLLLSAAGYSLIRAIYHADGAACFLQP